MDSAVEKVIIENLNRFNFKHKLGTDTEKSNKRLIFIYLPFLCYIKVSLVEDKIKMSSYIHFGLTNISIEWNFLFYTTALFILTAAKWGKIDEFIFVFLFALLLYLIICFIKTESLKSTLIRWIDDANRRTSN
jgi:hypothetical protein